MSFFSNLIVPLVLCMVFLGALVQRVDLLSAFARGVREGLQVVLDMFPSLMLLTLAVSVFQSSGALELLSRALSAPASLLGLPEPIIPLTLLRPPSTPSPCTARQRASKKAATPRPPRCAPT